MMKKDMLLDTLLVVGVGLMAWGLGVKYGKKISTRKIQSV